ncbi:hypothetical protein SBRCBS47491_001132 [Sporothrix bragantina]|uniref:Uncharacterized protein n=1 Tax=Sporothrix bragantina TaxID=671064 RepID=A0ABP0AW13_9PEZI
MAASRTTLKSTSHLVPSASFSYQDESPSGTGPPVDEEIPDIDEQHQNGLTLQNSDQPVSEAEQRGDKVLASFVLRFEAETRSSKGRSGNYLSKAEGLSILEDNSPEQGAMIKGYQGQPAPLGNLSTSLPTTLSLWDRAYDALRKDGNPASNEEPPIQPMPPHNVALGHDYQSEFLSISPPQLTDEQKDCIQMFRLTSNDSDTAYEWYKSGVEERARKNQKLSVKKSATSSDTASNG